MGCARAVCGVMCVNYLCLSRLIATGILGGHSPAEHVDALLLATCWRNAVKHSWKWVLRELKVVEAVESYRNHW